VELDPPLAWWCEPSDVESLASALRQFRERPRFPASNEVQQKRERLAISHTARAYLDFYADLPRR